MRVVEAISISIAALRSNKLRSLLTMLGIIIGVASVLAMIAIGDGAQEIVRQDIQKLGGPNQFIIYQQRFKRVNNRWVRSRSSEYLKYEDVLAMEAGCPSLKAVAPQVWNWSGVLIQAPGGAETRAGWNGVGANYKTAMEWDLKEGRFITDEDVENGAKVCVLGNEIAIALFGDKSPLGQEVKIARHNEYYSWRHRKKGFARKYTWQKTARNIVRLFEENCPLMTRSYPRDENLFRPIFCRRYSSETRKITSNVYRLGVNRYEHLEKALAETLMEQHKSTEVASVFKHFKMESSVTPDFQEGL